MFAASVDKALDFLSEEADSLHVFWPEPGLRALARRIRDRRGDRAGPSGARRSASALFGNHPTTSTPTTAEMRTLTEREVAGLVRSRAASRQRRADRRRRDRSGGRSFARPNACCADGRATGHAARTAARRRPAPRPHACRPTWSSRAAAPRGWLYTDDARRQSADIRSAASCRPFARPATTSSTSCSPTLLERRTSVATCAGARRQLLAARATPRSVRGGTSWISGRVDVDARAHSRRARSAAPLARRRRGVADRSERFEQLRWNTARRSGLMHATGQQLASRAVRRLEHGLGAGRARRLPARSRRA